MYAGRTTSGSPTSSRAAQASFMEPTVALVGTGSSMSWRSLRNSSLSSAFLMVCSGVPSSRTPYLSRTPESARSTARLSPVCPPRVGRMPSGPSASMILVSTSTMRGSM